MWKIVSLCILSVSLAFALDFPGEKAEKLDMFCGGVWDNPQILIDTVIDCSEIRVAKYNLEGDESVTTFSGNIEASKKFCDVNKIIPGEGLKAIVERASFSEKSSCKKCGVEKRDTTAYDSIEITKTKEGYGLNRLIRNKKVVEEQIIYDKRRYRSKIYLLDTLMNDTLFRFILNSRYDGDSLLLRTVDTDTLVGKKRK